MNFATPYNIDANAWSDKTALHCKDKTLAQQQFRDECNINTLFAKYMETGEMPQVEQGLSYGNFEGIFDFQTAMNAVRTAEGLFSQLPARIKNRFDNDPQKMLEFLAVDENREEAEFLGLVNKPEKPNEPGKHAPGSPEVTQPNPQNPTGTKGTPTAQGTNPPAQKP